jgi:hypothetical protein
MTTSTPLGVCACCGQPAQWWDGNCRAVLCAGCVPRRDEYVVALHHLRNGQAQRRIRPGLPTQPRWPSRGGAR